MEYTIVEAVTTESIVASVGDLIAEGWTPLGGVAYVMDGGEGKLVQALTRGI